MRALKFPIVEEILWRWYLGTMNDHVFLTDSLILEKVAIIINLLNVSDESFKHSSRWISWFKTQYRIH